MDHKPFENGHGRERVALFACSNSILKHTIMPSSLLSKSSGLPSHESSGKPLSMLALKSLAALLVEPS